MARKSELETVEEVMEDLLNQTGYYATCPKLLNEDKIIDCQDIDACRNCLSIEFKKRFRDAVLLEEKLKG